MCRAAHPLFFTKKNRKTLNIAKKKLPLHVLSIVNFNKLTTIHFYQFYIYEKVIFGCDDVHLRNKRHGTAKDPAAFGGQG